MNITKKLPLNIYNTRELIEIVHLVSVNIICLNELLLLILYEYVFFTLNQEVLMKDCCLRRKDIHMKTIENID